MEENKQPKILLVDDNKNNILSMEIVLETQNYVFEKAFSGKEALRILLKDQDFSLILLDVKMPIMDGYETAELIYQRDSLKHIPIIFITAHDYQEEAIFKGYKYGAVDFIRKPFNPHLLKAKVAVFIELFRKNQLLKQHEEKLKAINADLEIRVKERTSELEALNLELKALNISKDRFLSVISHDLRNPLSSILMSSEFLRKKAESLEIDKVKSISEVIHNSSKKILQQLNDLVAWAMEQRQKTRFKANNLILANEVIEAIELLKSFASQKNIELIHKVDRHLSVKADSYMLRSILQNIITNAIKYTPESGEPVLVTAIKKDQMIELCIEDKGIGMSSGTKELLFKNEVNKSSLGTNNEQGTGLGLLLVKDFIMQHGGTITVESEEGKGTKFMFTLPESAFEVAHNSLKG